MAEIQTTVRPGSQYESDDVLFVWTDHRIGHVHACHICLPQFTVRLPNGKEESRLKDMDVNGIMPPGHPSEDYGQTICTLQFERVSQTEVIMRRLADGAEHRIVSGVPFDNPFSGKSGEHMHVEEFFLGYRRAPLFPVHGTVGREIVYLGNHKLDRATQDTLWSKLKSKHGHDRANRKYKNAPLEDQELKSFFVFPIPDVEEAEAEALMEGEENPDGTQKLKRRFKLNGLARFCGPGRHFSLVTEPQIRNPHLSVDIRDSAAPLDVADLLRDKSTNRTRRLNRRVNP